MNNHHFHRYYALPLALLNLPQIPHNAYCRFLDFSKHKQYAFLKPVNHHAACSTKSKAQALGRSRTERQGFEPWSHLAAATRFPSALLQPLGHLSKNFKEIFGPRSCFQILPKREVLIFSHQSKFLYSRILLNLPFSLPCQTIIFVNF